MNHTFYQSPAGYLFRIEVHAGGLGVDHFDAIGVDGSYITRITRDGCYGYTADQMAGELGPWVDYTVGGAR